MTHTTLFSKIALALFAAVAARGATRAADTATPSYPYGDGAFRSFVAESFRVAGSKKPDVSAQSFFKYMGSAIPASMDAAKPKLAVLKNAKVRANAERVLCTNLHKAIKKQIPKFSLDRGFEFSNTVKLGERQCFLQSVVIASLLQRAGIPAGVAMVSRNEKGAHCNNGHAVTVARLSDGNDILVDASDPVPFMAHQGLMVSLPGSGGGYGYVAPVYDSAYRITAYHSLRGNKTLKPSEIVPLDTAFLRSQFTYYRGERTPGGLFTPPLATPTGLAKSEKWLKQSVAECPKNPLAVYMLGKLQERQGKLIPARKSYSDAYLLYTRYGWVPDEEARALAAIKKRTTRNVAAATSP